MSYARKVKGWKSDSKAKWLIALVFLVTPFLILGFFLYWDKLPLEEQQKILGQRPTEKALVRNYLNLHLHDPDYEEVAWGEPLKTKHGTLIYLRYRAKNAFNALRLTEDLFLIEGEIARTVGKEESSLWTLYGISPPESEP